MKVLVIVPSYSVAESVCDVVHRCLPYADSVLVVDDACPDKSGQIVEREFEDIESVITVFHSENKGVGGAMKTGFKWALERDFDIIVKVDGDGQMDPSLVPGLIKPLVENRADFAKGNRFESPRTVRQMPAHRLIGNGFLSAVIW